MMFLLNQEKSPMILFNCCWRGFYKDKKNLFILENNKIDEKIFIEGIDIKEILLQKNIIQYVNLRMLCILCEYIKNEPDYLHYTCYDLETICLEHQKIIHKRIMEDIIIFMNYFFHKIQSDIPIENTNNKIKIKFNSKKGYYLSINNKIEQYDINSMDVLIQTYSYSLLFNKISFNQTKKRSNNDYLSDSYYNFIRNLEKNQFTNPYIEIPYIDSYSSKLKKEIKPHIEKCQNYTITCQNIDCINDGNICCHSFSDSLLKKYNEIKISCQDNNTHQNNGNYFMSIYNLYDKLNTRLRMPNEDNEKLLFEDFKGNFQRIMSSAKNTAIFKGYCSECDPYFYLIDRPISNDYINFNEIITNNISDKQFMIQRYLYLLDKRAISIDKYYIERIVNFIFSEEFPNMFSNSYVYRREINNYNKKMIEKVFYYLRIWDLLFIKDTYYKHKNLFYKSTENLNKIDPDEKNVLRKQLSRNKIYAIIEYEGIFPYFGSSSLDYNEISNFIHPSYVSRWNDLIKLSKATIQEKRKLLEGRSNIANNPILNIVPDITNNKTYTIISTFYYKDSDKNKLLDYVNTIINKNPSKLFFYYFGFLKNLIIHDSLIKTLSDDQIRCLVQQLAYCKNNHNLNLEDFNQTIRDINFPILENNKYIQHTLYMSLANNKGLKRIHINDSSP